MKQLILIMSIVLVTIVSCKKEVSIASKDLLYLESVKASLRESMSSEDLQNLDFLHPVRTQIEEEN
ncbi:MAG: hypothetical protein EOP48_01775, partial [Sphingobacteriales bacterium]